jgi:rod shape determining protein RodA
MIAVGSGGVYGKGYMQGTQTHLDFIPERTTDFIFAVFSEEFGFYGSVMLLVLYGLMVLRGLTITVRAPTQFGRLLAGAMSMMMFVYVFVNIGMVTGVLPVVGVPLPFMSYGGTALMTLGIACGLLMSIGAHQLSPSDRRGR